jgi:hypothetical protein
VLGNCCKVYEINENQNRKDHERKPRKYPGQAFAVSRELRRAAQASEAALYRPTARACCNRRSMRDADTSWRPRNCMLSIHRYPCLNSAMERREQPVSGRTYGTTGPLVQVTRAQSGLPTVRSVPVNICINIISIAIYMKGCRC